MAPRHRLLRRLCHLLEAVLHDCPDAWAAAPLHTQTAGKLLTALSAILVADSLPKDLRFFSAAILGALLADNRAAQFALQDGPQLPNFRLRDGSAEQQSSIVALVFQALHTLWDECRSSREDPRALPSLSGALCGVLLHSDEAKCLALGGGWAQRMLKEVHAVPELLRFAVGHGDPRRSSASPAADGQPQQAQLEERLFLALAQLQCLTARSAEAKCACVEPPLDKAVSTLFALPPYRQAALSREPNRQNRLLCELLALIVNLGVDCPEARSAMVADPNRQKKSILHTLLAMAMLPVAPHSPVLGLDRAFQPGRGDRKEGELNSVVFRQLFEAIAAVVTDCEVGIAVVGHSPFLPFLSQSMEQWMKRKAAPSVKRLLPTVRLLAAMALHERGQAAILQTPQLLALALQCADLRTPPNGRAPEFCSLRQAALLLVRNLSCFTPTKVQVTNERSLDTLACLMRALRESDDRERCLAVEALLALVHNSAKARAIIKQQTMWHTELMDIFEHLPDTSRVDAADTELAQPSAADHIRLSLQTVVSMLA
eukprot:GGOE01042661.1.p1 GENE.GGOE01042661.1~~GGOE01042661.1.p1  ORF type:complete len:636 (+),score=173.59 GGOE01042661.1:280-1908(+)